jgi:hypothetical protein
MNALQQDNREEVQENDLVQEVAEEFELNLQNQQQSSYCKLPLGDSTKSTTRDGPQLLLPADDASTQGCSSSGES